jgi:hypothetical protein
MSKCRQKKGLFGYCRKESMHPGDHDNGRTTWPRVGSDLRIYRLATTEVDRLRAERRRLDAPVERHGQGGNVGLNGACEHSFEYSHLEFGEIKYREGNEPRPYREFWHLYACTSCGVARREDDEYYGDDMAQIHMTWRGQ